MPVETELYDTLGVSPIATQQEIKKAYRRLAVTHHPDKGGNEDMFKKITSAYEILKDKNKKDVYDKFGSRGLKGHQGVPSDIFANLFGGGLGDIFNMFRDVKKATQREKPVVYNRSVTLEELCTRKILNIKVTRTRSCVCQKDMASQRQCETCEGKGQIINYKTIGPGMVQGFQRRCDVCAGRGIVSPFCGACKNGKVESPKIFNIYLTPDMTNGYQYKFGGEGNESPGVLPGDFIVRIVHKPHEVFVSRGKNLIYNRKTTLRESLCGYNSIVLHPTGENIVVSFPGVITPGSKIAIKGKGLDKEGDLIVVHDVVFPVSLTDDQMKRLGEILK